VRVFAGDRVADEASRRLPGADLYQRMTYVELKQRLAELLLMRLDRTAMVSSVEGREPFLDHQLVEYALALPPRMKHRGGQGKWILREAVKGLLPDEILTRPKQGFGTPMVEWLRGPFGPHARERVRSSTLADRGLFDYDVVDSLFAAHQRGRADWSYLLWNLFNVSAWHDRWVAGERELAPVASS
jgi:asparagine synthase (glutamine-hydrolysing)